MNTVQANLINGISLILLGFWGYLDVDSPTALIPVFFGIILLLCQDDILVARSYFYCIFIKPF